MAQISSRTIAKLHICARVGGKGLLEIIELDTLIVKCIFNGTDTQPHNSQTAYLRQDGGKRIVAQRRFDLILKPQQCECRCCIKYYNFATGKFHLK